jgi:hypothetical protein
MPVRVFSFTEATMQEGESKYTPTPEEIAERCAEIQRGWSDTERLSRRRCSPGASYYDPAVEQMARFELDHRLAKRRERMK